MKLAIGRALGEDIPIKMVYDLTATFAQQMQAEGVVATNKVSEALQKEYGLDEVQAGIVASAAASAFGGIGKAKGNSQPKIEQILKPEKNWETARNKALDLVGNLGADSKPVIGRLEVSTGNGKVIGRQSSDGKVGWRVASDPENQAMLVSGGLLVKDKTKAAISFMSRNTATATVKATEVGMQWEQENMKQGMLWEDYVGKSLPADARLPKNFKTFDYYDGATKTATSVKSMDTQTMAKLANPNQVYGSIKGKIDAAAKFKEYALSGRELTPSMIFNREIQLVIPADTTKTQWAEINRAIEYGKSQGVKVTVTQVK